MLPPQRPGSAPTGHACGDTEGPGSPRPIQTAGRAGAGEDMRGPGGRPLSNSALDGCERFPSAQHTCDIHGHHGALPQTTGVLLVCVVSALCPSRSGVSGDWRQHGSDGLNPSSVLCCAVLCLTPPGRRRWKSSEAGTTHNGSFHKDQRTGHRRRQCFK